MQTHISVEGDRVAGASLHSIEWPPSSFPHKYAFEKLVNLVLY